MHYVFRSRSDADLIMMGPIGDRLLHIVGKEPAPQGIIEAAAMPAAIAAIEAASMIRAAVSRSAPGRCSR